MSDDDTRQFAVICREVGTEFINIYSRHPTRGAAQQAHFAADRKHNADRFTYWLTVVDL